MTSRMLRLLAFPLALCAAHVHAQEWSRFRGPNGTGESETAGIPIEWTADAYDWRVALPGVGHSSPVVWGKTLFVTSADEQSGRRFLLCLDADSGETKWRREFAGTPYHIHRLNSRASSTPTVDEENVYFIWGSPEKLTLYAYTHDGDEAWSCELGPYASQHGFGGSPMLFDNLVIVVDDQSVKDDLQGSSSIVAVDRKSGEVRWRTERRTREAGYSVPCILAGIGSDPQLIVNTGAEGISGVDPASGDVHWSIDVFKLRSVSSPIVSAGLVFGSCGSGGGGNYLVAVEPGDAKSDKEPRIAYRIRTAAPYVPTPVANGELLFLWYDKGAVTCINAATGDEIWRERVDGAYFGSPIRVGNRLYCIESDSGDVVVVSATDKFELLARNPLGEPSRSTPAVANGKMYLRTFSHLAAIGGDS